MQKKTGVVSDLKGKVLQIIYSVVDDLNEETGSGKIEKSPETPLLGSSSAFDSLKLVNLIVAVEQKVEEEFGFAISAIANEKALSQKTSPLRNIGSLADFIALILSEERK